MQRVAASPGIIINLLQVLFVKNLTEFCGVEWRLSFPDASVHNLPKAYSDHCPVLVSLNFESPIKKVACPFHFEAAWLTHDTFVDTLRNSWH